MVRTLLQARGSSTWCCCERLIACGATTARDLLEVLGKVLGQRLLDQGQVFRTVHARGLVDVVGKAGCACVQDGSAMGASTAASMRENTHVHSVADHRAIRIGGSAFFDHSVVVVLRARIGVCPLKLSRRGHFLSRARREVILATV